MWKKKSAHNAVGNLWALCKSMQKRPYCCKWCKWKWMRACAVILLLHFENKECLDQVLVLRHEVLRFKSRFPHQLKYSRIWRFLIPRVDIEIRVKISQRKVHGIFVYWKLWPSDCVWNVMAHAQKPDFVFRRNWRVHLNRQGRQFSRLLAPEVYVPAVVMLDTPSSEVVWRVLATHSIHQFPLHFPSNASPCAITFQLDSTAKERCSGQH
jgi:hypothetical protein